MASFNFPTDTATLAIFDPDRLAHRLGDYCDWWSDPAEELKEINSGNLLSISIGTDGYYHAEVSFGSPPQANQFIEARIVCESGNLFIGPGELLPGENTPTAEGFGGQFLHIVPGSYLVQVTRPSFAELPVFLQPTDDPARNAFTVGPHLNENT